MGISRDEMCREFDLANMARRQELRKERADYDARSVNELLADIRARRFGHHYEIWHSLADRASLQEVGWVLYDVLVSDADYLNRHHCAGVLIAIARRTKTGFGEWVESPGLQFLPSAKPYQIASLQAAGLCAPRFPMARNLAKLREGLEELLGKYPDQDIAGNAGQPPVA